MKMNSTLTSSNIKYIYVDASALRIKSTDKKYKYFKFFSFLSIPRSNNVV